jgi:integrase
LVSQRVSQEASETAKSSNKCSNDSACRAKSFASARETYGVTSNQLVVPDPRSIVRKSEPGDDNSNTRVTSSNENLTQRKTPPSGFGPTHILDTPVSQSASTAPSPNSYEEVSGMPGKGNGCIFKTHTKAGKAIWKVEVTVGYKPNGQRIRTRRTAHSLAAAREIHRQLISESHTGDLRTQSSETFAEYSLWWLHTVKSMNVRPSTISDYEDRLRRNVFPHFGQRRLHEITSRDVQNWLHILQKKGASTTTINGARQVFGAVFKYAVRVGLVPKNPVELTERAKRQWGEKTSVKDPWSLEEAQQVLAVTQGTKFDLFARIGILLGARRGEILALRWSDIDFEKGFISIAGSLREQRTIGAYGRGKTTLVVGDTKTQSSRRKLALTAEILASLQRHRDVVASMKNSAGKAWKETDWVFVDTLGGLTYPSNFAKQFTKFLSEHQIRIIRIHDLRHTAAVLSLEAGVRLEAVSQALGHSRIDITKSVYAPYVQPLITEFAVGISEYVAPIDSKTLLLTDAAEVLN